MCMTCSGLWVRRSRWKDSREICGQSSCHGDSLSHIRSGSLWTLTEPEPESGHKDGVTAGVLWVMSWQSAWWGRTEDTRKHSHLRWPSTLTHKLPLLSDLQLLLVPLLADWKVNMNVSQNINKHQLSCVAVLILCVFVVVCNFMQRFWLVLKLVVLLKPSIAQPAVTSEQTGPSLMGLTACVLTFIATERFSGIRSLSSDVTRTVSLMCRNVLLTFLLALENKT